jgi:hypothetical protein
MLYLKQNENLKSTEIGRKGMAKQNGVIICKNSRKSMIDDLLFYCLME